MPRGKGSRFVLVMVLASSLLLLLSAFGVLPKPIRGAKRFQVDSTATAQPSGTSELTGDTDPGEDPGPPLETDPLPVELKELPVSGNDPDTLAAGGTSLRLWPESLALPVLHAPDLDAYLGQEAAPQPLKGITVILDAPHGGADTGSVWETGREVVMEKTLVLDIAMEAEKALASLGATVIMTRTTDEEFSLFRTVAKAADIALIRYGDAAVANGYSRDLPDNLRLLMGDIIRINQNSPSSGGRGLFGSIGTPPQLRLLYDIESQFTDILFINISLAFDVNDPGKHGSQAYYMSAAFVENVNNGYADGQDAQALAPNYTLIDSQGRARLASLLKTSLAAAEPRLLPEDGSEAGAQKDMAVLRLTNFVSASLVAGYLSNEGDRQVLNSAQGRQAIGQALARAVLQYYVTASP
ncbi:MAG: N-acetylmuramoyl-L-alanine amidase [Saccharofermentanales bacterium]|jgi:N-acetylmuramoyl-L-alanine amidase